MDFSRLKKTIAGLSATAISITQMGVALAAHNYSDVSANVWYESAVHAFADAGYLDTTQTRFRPGDNANRAEFVKLVVELNGGILSTPPAVPSFTDVQPGAWYYGYIEEAAKEGWVRGDGNCYGTLPCYSRPGANINRAEAAALIVRSFGLEETGDAPQFVDNPNGQWYTDVIQTAADHCVLQGDDATGRVRPADNMNRAEMVTMLHRVDQNLVYGIDCGDDMTPPDPMITDVISVSDTMVEVEFNVALDMTSAEDVDNYTVVGGATELGVTSATLVGDDLVELTLANPTVANQRYTLTVTNLETDGGEMFSDAMDFTGYSPIAIGDGILELSLAASNPVADTVPKGALGVVMLSVDLTASCDDSVVVEDLTVLHEGFGRVSDISGVYAAVDGARVTRKRTIDSQDQTANLRFARPLVINACDSVTLDVVADFATGADTSGEHNFVVELASDVVSNARDVRGNFPVRGNTFRVASVTTGIITVEYRTVTPDEVEIGDTGVVVGKFQVKANATEDQTLYSMTLENNGSVSDGEVTNIAIRRTDGTVLTNTAPTTVGDYVTLVFDPPFTILEGDRITLEVIGDIVGGAGDTVQFTFEEESDIFAVGSLYGYGVNGQLYGSQVTIDPNNNIADIINIDAGEFTISINGPSGQDYTRDDDDAVLANVKFKTGEEDIDVQELYVAIQGQSQTGGLLCASGASGATDCGTAGSDDEISEVISDIEIRNKVTGRTINGVRLTTSSASGHSTSGTVGTFQIYRFDDFIVQGEQDWELRVDFNDNESGFHPDDGDKFRVHICGEPERILENGSLITNTTGCTFGGLITASTTYQMVVEGLSTGDKVGDVRPRGTISGNFHRIANANLTIATKDLNTTNTAVENADDINLLRFEARAGEAEDILFTKAVFKSSSGSLNNIQNYTLWVDTDGDGTVDTILQSGVAGQGSTVSFSKLAGGGFVIPAEETVTFEVHGDVSASLTNDDFQLGFSTGTTNYIEAEELDDGSTLSGISTNGTCASSPCDITVTETASTLWSLIASGDLYVTADSTPVKNRQLLGGALGESVLRLNFYAENEDVDVTNIQITSSGSTAGSVERLELFRDGETSPFAFATTTGCGTDAALTYNPGNGNATVKSFCANMGSRQLVVPEGDDTDVIIRPRMKRDTSGGVSNQLIQFFITDAGKADNSTGSGAIRADGDESSNPLSGNDGDGTAEGEIFIGTSTVAANSNIVGVKHRSVLSKITSIVDANPDSNNTSVPTGIAPFGQFTITAAAHNNSNNGLNDVVLSGVVFNVNATNVQLDGDNFRMYNKADSSTGTSCSAFLPGGSTALNTASGAFVVRCDNLVTASVNTEIDQGTSATFVLEGEVTDTQISTSASSTLQASIRNFSSIGATSFGTSNSSTTSHFYWQDKDGASCTGPGGTGTTTCGNFLWVEYPETVVNSTSYKS